MTLMDVGRLCRVTRGREALEPCVIVDKVDDNTTLIAGPNVKSRKISINHLEPYPLVVKVSKGASQDKVVKALEKEGLV